MFFSVQQDYAAGFSPRRTRVAAVSRKPLIALRNRWRRRSGTKLEFLQVEKMPPATTASRSNDGRSFGNAADVTARRLGMRPATRLARTVEDRWNVRRYTPSPPAPSR
jgi:hypothetical protein